VDETGKSGGQALLDATALACDGGLDRALELSSGVDYELKTRPLVDPSQRAGRGGNSYMEPKVWFLMLKDKTES